MYNIQILFYRTSLEKGWIDKNIDCSLLWMKTWGTVNKENANYSLQNSLTEKGQVIFKGKHKQLVLLFRLEDLLPNKALSNISAYSSMFM